MPRRGYSNVAYPVYLLGSLDGTSTSNTITVSTEPSGTAASPPGWPATYPFFAVIDPDTASEEIVSVTAGSGGTLTITRGGSLGVGAYGSATKAHQNGAKILHVATAADFDEANSHVNASAQVHGLAAGSSVVGTADTQTLSNKTLSSPTFTGTITADFLTAWTAYTPTLSSSGTTQPVLGDGTLTGRFKQIGKTVHFSLRFLAGSTTTFGDGNTLYGLPVAARTAPPWGVLAVLEDASPFTRHMAMSGVQDANRVFLRNYAGTTVTATAPWTWAASDGVILNGTYEAA